MGKKKTVEKSMNINCLAIFSPYLGAISETFITNHIKLIAPGKTIVVTEKIEDDSWTNCPVKLAPFGFGKFKYSASLEKEIVDFLRYHSVTQILCEYGGLGPQIVELNYRVLKLPIFIHYHGFDASEQLRQPEVVSYYKWMGGKVTAIIVDTEIQKERLVSLGMPEAKFNVIPYGIEIPKDKASHESSLCRFISVTRLVPKKGPLYLLNAFKKAKEKIPDITLDIIGDGPLREQVERFVKENNLRTSVFIHGAQPNNFVKEKLLTSNAYVQHSIADPETGDAEGLPVAILEASAVGLPIISTLHEGIPDEVEHEVTGFLVDEFDVEGMADYMVKLAKDGPLRKKMGAAGREKMKTEFKVDMEISRLKTLIGFGIENSSHNVPIESKFSSADEETNTSRNSREKISKKPNIEPISISVVIPAYNRAQTIRNCFDSVLKQTLSPFEIIIVDDGSTDETVKIVKSYEHPKLKYITLENNSGAQAARNRGIMEAKGDWIAFQDSDDEWHPEKLEKQFEALAKVDFDPFTLVHTDAWQLDYVTNQKTLLQSSLLDGPDVYPRLLSRSGLLFPSMLVSKLALEKIGYLDENVPSWQEWDTSIRLAKHCRFIHLQEPLFIYHLHKGETISKGKKQDIEGYEYILEKFEDEIKRVCGEDVWQDHLFTQLLRCLNYECWTESDRYFQMASRRDRAFWYFYLHRRFHLKPYIFRRIKAAILG